MTKMSKLALVAAIAATGTAGLTIAVPATAAKKEQAAPGLKLSPEVLKPAQAAQAAITAKDVATAEPAVAQVEAAAKTDDDKYIAASLRYNLEVTKLQAAQAANPNAPVNEAGLAGPLDVLIASANTPAADKGRYAYRRGVLAYNAKQYDVAMRNFTLAQQAGYNDPNLPLQLAATRVSSGDTAGGLSALSTYVDAERAAGRPVKEEIYRFAIGKANAAKMRPETMAWMQRLLAAYPTQKNWRDMVVVYGLQQGSIVSLAPDQQIDLYRLLRAKHALGDQYDYETYAQQLFKANLPFETRAVITEGKSAGKIPASSTAMTSMLKVAGTSISNDISLAAQEKTARAGSSGAAAGRVADSYFGSADYAKAADLYRVALQKGGVDADAVNTHLGIALAMSGDKAGARTAFAAVKGAPRADIAGFWTTSLDAA